MAYCSVQDVLHEFTPTLRLNMERDYGSDERRLSPEEIEKW